MVLELGPRLRDAVGSRCHGFGMNMQGLDIIDQLQTSSNAKLFVTDVGQDLGCPRLNRRSKLFPLAGRQQSWWLM